MPRVLMIHYNFPPLGGIGSVRAVRLARYLPEAGWTPLVVAPRRPADHEDRTLLPANQEIWFTSSFEWAVTLKRAFPRPQGVNGRPRRHRGWYAARDVVHRLLYIPDGQIGWYPFAVRAARVAAKARKPEVIFSSSPPVTAHLIARRVSHETGIPWVAEYRDLWTDWHLNGRWRQAIDERIERSLLAAATATVTVSPTYERVLGVRGARRVAMITNGFDSDDFRTERPDVDDVLTYVGSYHEDQDVTAGLRALAHLLQGGMLPGFRLRIVGSRTDDLASAIRAAGVESSVEWTGFVNHQESVRLMSRSRVLLLAGPTGSADPVVRGHIPGKTFEYLASGRPILYVGDLESDVAAIIRPFPQARLVSGSDETGARAALEDLVSRPPGASNGRPPMAYSHRELAARLGGIFTEVAG